MHRFWAAFINSGMRLHGWWCCPLQPLCSARHTDMCVYSNYLEVGFFPFPAVDSARGWLKWKAIRSGKIPQKAETHMPMENEVSWHGLEPGPGPTAQPELSGRMKQLIRELLWKGLKRDNFPTCHLRYCAYLLDLNTNSHCGFNRRLAFKFYCTLNSFLPSSF